MSHSPMRPCRRRSRASLRTRLSLLALEDRLTPAVFNIPNGDVAALTAAVNTVNANSEPDTINLAANGTYTFTAPAVSGGSDALPPVVLDGGNPANSLTLNGNGATLQRSTAVLPPLRLLSVVGAETTLNDLTVANWNGFFAGGGVLASNLTLAVNRCRFVGNSSDYGGGLAIRDTFRLTVTDCAFLQNLSRQSGGALSVESGVGESSAVIRGTLIDGNTSRHAAAGVEVRDTSLAMSNVVMRANFAQGGFWDCLNLVNYRPVTAVITDCVFRDNLGEKTIGLQNLAEARTQLVRTTVSTTGEPGWRSQLRSIWSIAPFTATGLASSSTKWVVKSPPRS